MKTKTSKLGALTLTLAVACIYSAALDMDTSFTALLYAMFMVFGCALALVFMAEN